jgi:hypothetical protein
LRSNVWGYSWNKAKSAPIQAVIVWPRKTAAIAARIAKAKHIRRTSSAAAAIRSANRFKGAVVRTISDFLFLILFVVLVGAWLILWAAFHIAGGMIHILLVIAVIALILHLVRGRSAA